MRTACIVQGNVRNGTLEILTEMCKVFDFVIFSTWEGENIDLSSSNFKVIYNSYPKCFGSSNRNLLRKSTSAAFEKIKELDVKYVCKIRSDMLFLNISKESLLKYYDPYDNNRILTFSYRCLTSNPDWYSSINDMFSFGPITLMDLLWNDNDIDYSKSINLPPASELSNLNTDLDFEELWQPETELYAFFKYRIFQQFNALQDHITIIRKYFILVDYSYFNILWFSDSSFRSIFQAYHHPWWDNSNYLGLTDPKIVKLNRELSYLETLRYQFSKIIVRINIFKSHLKYFYYTLRNKNV